MDLFHTLLKRLHCQHYDFSTFKFDLLKSHSLTHSSKRLHCQHCDFSNVKFDLLKSHSLEHCQHCDFTTIRLDILKSHFLTHSQHTGEKLQCKLCDYVTYVSCAMEFHSREHNRATVLAAVTPN